jgi:hypothetical protein
MSGVKAWKVRTGWGSSISGHRYQMLFAADINSGGVGMNQRQALEMNSFTGIIFLFAHSF